MRLSRGKKILIGALTAWPVVYMGLFFVFVFGTFFMASSRRPGPEMPVAVGVLFGAHCLTMLLMFGLMVFYVVHIVKATFKKSEMKIIWLILVLMGGILAMPVYWYMNIWHEMQTVEDASEPADAQPS